MDPQKDKTARPLSGEATRRWIAAQNKGCPSFLVIASLVSESKNGATPSTPQTSAAQTAPALA